MRGSGHQTYAFVDEKGGSAGSKCQADASCM